VHTGYSWKDSVVLFLYIILFSLFLEHFVLLSADSSFIISFTIGTFSFCGYILLSPNSGVSRYITLSLVKTHLERWNEYEAAAVVSRLVFYSHRYQVDSVFGVHRSKGTWGAKKKKNDKGRGQDLKYLVMPPTFRSSMQFFLGVHLTKEGSSPFGPW
jgi:hypothetical protein